MLQKPYWSWCFVAVNRVNRNVLMNGNSFASFQCNWQFPFLRLRPSWSVAVNNGHCWLSSLFEWALILVAFRRPASIGEKWQRNCSLCKSDVMRWDHLLASDSSKRRMSTNVVMEEQHFVPITTTHWVSSMVSMKYLAALQCKCDPSRLANGKCLVSCKSHPFKHWHLDISHYAPSDSFYKSYFMGQPLN